MSETKVQEKPADIRTAVRQHYGEAAASFQPKSSGCGCSKGSAEPNASKLYSASDLETMPEEVTGLSMGCGDPITLATLKPGQTVLDLGSGGGIDCFMAAKKVGETGHVIGVDMTAEMLEKARANQSRMGFKNVEFRLGEIEHLPVADNTVDVIISNCVINLSQDKPKVFREAYRALKPGGRLMVSDIVLLADLPESILSSIEAYVGCIAGASKKSDYLEAIQSAGFKDVKVADETVFPTDSMANDPTVQAIIKEAKITTTQIKKIANSVVSVKVSALK